MSRFKDAVQSFFHPIRSAIFKRNEKARKIVKDYPREQATIIFGTIIKLGLSEQYYQEGMTIDMSGHELVLSYRKGTVIRLPVSEMDLKSSSDIVKAYKLKLMFLGRLTSQAEAHLKRWG